MRLHLTCEIRVRVWQPAMRRSSNRRVPAKRPRDSKEVLLPEFGIAAFVLHTSSPQLTVEIGAASGMVIVPVGM